MTQVIGYFITRLLAFHVFLPSNGTTLFYVVVERTRKKLRRQKYTVIYVVHSPLDKNALFSLTIIYKGKPGSLLAKTKLRCF